MDRQNWAQTFVCVCILKAEQELSCFAGSVLHVPILPCVIKKEEIALVVELLEVI